MKFSVDFDRQLAVTLLLYRFCKPGVIPDLRKEVEAQNIQTVCAIRLTGNGAEPKG